MWMDTYALYPFTHQWPFELFPPLTVVINAEWTRVYPSVHFPFSPLALTCAQEVVTLDHTGTPCTFLRKYQAVVIHGFSPSGLLSATYKTSVTCPGLGAGFTSVVHGPCSYPGPR
jgi:hypothetical protein